MMDLRRIHDADFSPHVANSVQELLEQIIAERDALCQALASLKAGLAKLEKRLEDTDHRVGALEAKMVSTQGCVVKHATLMKELAVGKLVADYKLETLENKLRARNLRVTGIPAAIRNVNLIPFIENLLPAALDLNDKQVPICIESAYRLPANNAQVGKGSTVLITLSDLRHREKILKTFWTTNFHGHKISFFPDLSPLTYARRKHFVALKQQFLKEGVQAYVLYPSKLKVLYQEKMYIFKDIQSADHLLDEIRKEKMTMTLIRNRLALLVLGILVTFVLYLLLPAIQHEKFTASVDIPKPRAMEEEVKNAGNVTIATGTILHSSVFFREAVLVQKDVASSTERLAVIFLHGQSFTSKTWETLGTLALLAENGYRAVAIDLPGYGSSPRSASVGTAKGRISFLEQVFKDLGLQKPILISSSMSGRYSIPFLFSSGEQLKGFVSIAPVGTKDFTAQQYQQLEIPTLIIYGQRDTDLGVQSLQNLQQIPRSRVVMLLGAGHACYLDKPQEFHKALLSFLSELK
ncbi:protein ABHD14A-like [Pseudonaja textilis]|uniref:Protein ABHD14A-like n=1 Tax=Pseudonaja textilis TaxID=8673 RepID=A0A670YID3_PSETE|nr:protein ABHD14A-like [Pseudonaja textilis]